MQGLLKSPHLCQVNSLFKQGLMSKHHLLLIAALCSFTLPANADQQVDNTALSLSTLKDEIRWLNEEKFVSTATKTRERISKSGSSVSVITQDDLKKMGARNLMDALKRLPGFSIQTTNIGIPAIEVRGVLTGDSEKVLFQINGHSINNNLINGSALWSYSDFNINNIKRVEVIRGPGSALHGTDAFVAVINIITNSFDDIDGVELRLGSQSNSGKSINVQVANELGQLKFALNADLSESNGRSEHVEADSLGNTGKTLDWRKNYDLSFNMSYAEFQFQGKYHIRQNGPFIGIGSALNDESEQEYIEYFLDLSYQKTISNNFSFMSRLYFDQFEANNFWEIFPENTTVTIPNVTSETYPDGLIGSPVAKNQKTGFEVQLDLQLGRQHKLLTGLLFEHQTQFDVQHFTNFDPTTIPLPSPQPQYENNSNQWNWNGRNSRDIAAFYIQDIWDINDQLRLINGARIDDYSDFGSDVNPRSSLTWEFMDNYNLGLAYGTAFRAPNFANLYNINNPAITGNPDLEPEEIETFEISLNGQLDKRNNFKLTSFRHHIRNLIESKPTGSLSVYQNSSKVSVNGLEMELSSRLPDGSSIDFNYTYQYPTNDSKNEVSPNIPLHKANLAFNYRYSRLINAYFGLTYRGELSRSSNDSRADIKPKTTVDTALNWKNEQENIELIASIYNLFNDQIKDASDGVPSDIPAEDRHIALKLIYKL